MALEKRKIADHQKALQTARKSSNKASVKYNQSHAEGHKKDLKDRQKAIKKYNKLKLKAAKR